MSRYPRRVGLLLAARGHEWAPFLQALWCSTFSGVQRPTGRCPVAAMRQLAHTAQIAGSPASAAVISVPTRGARETNPHVCDLGLSFWAWTCF